MSADTEVPNPANPQDFNRYSYVGNNPISRIDPNGHAALCVLDSCAGGLSGGVSQTSCCGSMARAALTVGGTAAAGAAGGYVAAKALNATPQDEEANADGNSSEEDHKQPLPWNTSIDAKGKDKVRKQMGQRGWTPEEVQDTLDNPADTGTSMDTRRDPETGEKRIKAL